MNIRSILLAQLITGLFSAVAIVDIALCQIKPKVYEFVNPPTGYIKVHRTLPAIKSSDALSVTTMNFPFSINKLPEDLESTFKDMPMDTYWANDIKFENSDNDLPPNHVGGLQGGYIGVQTKSAGQQAIFSIWFATDKEHGEGAKCIKSIEAWYHDDHPWVPPIVNINKTDPNRKVAGGPYWRCTLPIEIKAGEKYSVIVRRSVNPDWYEGVFIDNSGDEHVIGKLKVPATWRGLAAAVTSGFLEQFEDMPYGCRSIPPSQTTYYPVTATLNNGHKITSTISASLYGKCKKDLKHRLGIGCLDTYCEVLVRPPVIPIDVSKIGVSFALGRLYMWPQHGKSWKKVETNNSGHMYYVTLLQDGTLLAIGNNRSLYRRNGLSKGMYGHDADWELVDYSGDVYSFMIMNDGSLLGVGKDEKLYTREGIEGKWDPVPNSCCVTEVAINPKDGSLLGVGNDEKLYTREGIEGKWDPVPNSCCIMSVVINPKDGSRLGVGTDKELRTWEGIEGKWTPVPNSCCMEGVAFYPEWDKSTKKVLYTLVGIGNDDLYHNTMWLYTRKDIEGEWTRVPNSKRVNSVTFMYNHQVLRRSINSFNPN